MPSDYENGLKKIVDLSVQTEKMTSGIPKSAVQEFLSGSAEKSGQMTLKQLERKRGGKHKVFLNFRLPSWYQLL